MKGKSYNTWLHNDALKDNVLRNQYQQLLKYISIPEYSAVIHPVLQVAKNELIRSTHSLLDIMPVINSVDHVKTGTLIGTLQAMDWTQYGIDLLQLNGIGREGYLIQTVKHLENDYLVIIGGSPSGVLYGVYHLLRLMRMGRNLFDIAVIENPVNTLRMINQWDNADSSIERGYAGNSIFYQRGEITQNTDRIRDYANMLASIGINGITINNVNVHETETQYITERYLTDVARVADVFRGYGIQLFLSINFASPMQLGDLDTADPLDAQVQEWWKTAADTIYSYIPDFGGFLVKADSEHRPGPFTYGRDHADGANMLAEALKPHGGLVIWRCFVYNCMQDWRDRTTDRAKAAYDHFLPLDGAFHDNVILQIKNGPMDFQVREPVSPLFGAMSHTNQVLEFQITQEYTGQQKHLCYLVPQWKEVIKFDTYSNGEGSTVGQIVSGSRIGGYAAVSNIGDDLNWTGHTLAQANLYGYGRLIWNPELSVEQITEEWIKLTFNNDERVVQTIQDMLLQSWSIYENYTAPLGVGWMITPHHHYGPDIDGYEYSRWGTYHFADRNGIGVDRTVASGTGYTAQYAQPNASMYESLVQCPDNLLLFFHHVNYSHSLQSGKTVIQHIYDTHFEGTEQTHWLVKQWSSLEGLIDHTSYQSVLNRLQDQVNHAKLWCDVINTYFYRKSGIPDIHRRRIY